MRLIKKDTKNQIQIKPEFYELYNNDTKNIIELNEDENKKISNKTRVKKTKSNIIRIDNEIDGINKLIKNANNILNSQKFDNENKINILDNISLLINKDKYTLTYDENNNLEHFEIKSNGIKDDSTLAREYIKIKKQNKNEINRKKSKINNDSNVCIPKKLYNPANNNEQITSFDIEKKNNKEEGKENEKIEEKENNSFLCNNRLIFINNGNNFGTVRSNIQERKEDSILSSNSLNEKEFNFNDLNNYL